jgi:hypothetical protein
MFFKVTIAKSQLESTMTQDRLEALMLASMKDILLNSDDDELVASFADQ